MCEFQEPAGTRTAAIRVRQRKEPINQAGLTGGLALESRLRTGQKKDRHGLVGQEYSTGQGNSESELADGPKPKTKTETGVRLRT